MGAAALPRCAAGVWGLVVALVGSLGALPSGAATLTMRPGESLTAAVGRMQGGDTLIIPGGTYNEGNIAPPSGSEGSPTTLKAAPGATVTIRPWASGKKGIDTAILFRPRTHHIVIDGLLLDGGPSDSDRRTQFPVATQKPAGHHLTIRNSEIRRGHASCLLIQGSHWTLTNNYIHHCGTSRKKDHGVYFSVSHSVVTRNTFAHNSCYNIQVYGKDTGAQNRFEHNRFEASPCGFTLTHGRDHIVRANLIRDGTLHDTAKLLVFAPGTLVEGNTILRTPVMAINQGDTPRTTFRHNRFCAVEVTAQQATVQGNVETCAAVDPHAFGANLDRRDPGDETLPPLPAPRNLRVLGRR